MKNSGGFSLMEMLVVLLITAVVAAAAAPMISRKLSSNKTEDSVMPWIYVGSALKDIAYNPKGDNDKSVFIGATKNGNSKARLFVSTTSADSAQIGFGWKNDNNAKAKLLVDDKNSIAFNSGGEPGANSTSVGIESEAGGALSSAFGYNSRAAENSTAIGAFSKATGKNSTAIGAGAVSDKPNRIVLGTQNDTVVIPGILKVDKDILVDDASLFNNLRTGFSDRRLKNVGKAFDGGLDKIRQLQVYNYTFKADSGKTPHVGVMAQDLEKIFPDAVIKDDDGFLRIRLEDMFYAIINSIKELDIRTSKHDKDIEALKQQVEVLTKQNKELEAKIKTLDKK